MVAVLEEDLKRFFKRDRFAEFLGIELLEAGEGYARSRMQIGEEHLNGIGTVHGGAIFTLADFTFAVASNSHGSFIRFRSWKRCIQHHSQRQNR